MREKQHSLKRRWMTNSMGAVIAVIVLAALTICVALSTYTYSTLQKGLETRTSAAASYFRNYSKTEYTRASQNYAANFSEQNKMDLQFLNQNGRIRVSSYGITSGISPNTPDISAALDSGTVSSWSGHDPQTGEHIMAASAPIVFDGVTVGAVRMVTGLQNADRQVMVQVGLVILIGVVILSMMYLSSNYFLRSIIEPVTVINETAQVIAEGGYGIQVEQKYGDDELGQLVDTVNNMSTKLKQAEKVQQEFISSVSHELRTPLTAINGWAETIMNGELQSPEDVKKGMNIIVSEASRLTAMVEELLEFSRITDGRFTLQVEPIDIKAEFEDAVFTYKEFFRREGLELTHTDCEEEFEMINGDPQRLRQVFCNLLDNASKHGGSGKKIDTAIFPDGENIVIRIRDYGAGIPADEIPLVKKRFYKGSSKARGSGIGLAVCDEIIVRHGGTLNLFNAEGGGCAVDIRLPYTKAIT